jgi:hypothetical protein
VYPIAKPECHHGLPCVVRKVKKDGLNKGRLFFCCPNDKESTCRFFEWAPDEQVRFFQTVNFSKERLENKGCNKNNYLATEFINSLANELKL